ncbi:transglutaminase family protein [Polaromonas sp.]|uniref:transglutaminase family protein n=1 Tax=Polaromonas sp. TaxID=1869339 RepID=UPI002FC66194
MLERLLSASRHLPRDGRDTLFLLLVIAWVLLPQTGNLPWWCSGLAGGVLLWRGWLALKNQPLPGKWWLLGLLAIAVAATWLTHRTLLGRDAGVTLIVILLTLKTLELRARRDAFVIFFLGFFTMLTNFFYSQSLLTAFGMLLGLLGLLTALVNAHMPVGKPPLLQAAKTAGWMALLGAPVMVVLFMLFPRLAPLWGMPTDAMTGRSGLSASMQVGNIASLALDGSVAMRIKFEGATPGQQDLYFRGPVLSSFDGREWRPARANFSSRFGVSADLAVSGAPVNYEVTLEPTSRPWLFVMEAATQSPALPGLQSVMGPDLQWLTSRPITDLTRYKVQSYPTFRHGPQQRVAGLQEFVDLPPGFNPRTLALASEIRRDPRYAGANTAALVQAVLDRLRTGGYVYTLDPGVYGQHSADEFWFDRKEGFCEHIASAFVILMRAMDVPARIVTGYQGGERNALDNFWVVRQSDAHAWAEVWQAGRGWVRVDPTSAVFPGRTGAFQRLAAPQGVMAQALGTLSPTLLAQLRAAWEAVNNGWNQWILNYTQSKQLNLLKNMGFESPSWEDLSYVLLAIIVLVSLAGAAWTLWDRAQHDPWLRLLARARKQLARQGIESSPATSPRELALRVMARHGSRGQPLHDWLVQLEQQRYATAASTSTKKQASLHQLRKQFGELVWPA